MDLRKDFQGETEQVVEKVKSELAIILPPPLPRHRQPGLLDQPVRRPEAAGRREGLDPGHAEREERRAELLVPLRLQRELLRRELLQEMHAEGRPLRPLHLRPRRAAVLPAGLEGEILRRT